MGNPYAFLFNPFHRRHNMSGKTNLLQDQAESYVTISEAAELLRVSRRTVFRWMARGKVNVFRPSGGTTRIPRSELKRFIEENTGTHLIHG
jgi:excisionase family DNA binding protein